VFKEVENVILFVCMEGKGKIIVFDKFEREEKK